MAACKAREKAVCWLPRRENRTDLEQRLAEVAESIAES